MATATLTQGPPITQPRAVGDPYTLLNSALAAVEANPRDVTAALAACRSYIALGLIGPARELLSAGEVPFLDIAETRALHDQIAMIPSGRLTWAAHQRRFETNLQKLLTARQDLRVHEATLRASRNRLEVYQSRDGNRHLASRTATGRLSWTEMLIDAKQVVAQTVIPHPANALICPPYVVCHDRFCMLLAKLHAATKKMFLTFSPRLYLLAKDLDDLAATLYLSEELDHLCDPRVELLVGADCSSQLAAVLRAQSQRTIPEKLLCLPAIHSMQDCVLEQLRIVIRERQALRADDIHANQVAYEKDDLVECRKRFEAASANPLRILGITSRFTTVLQYSMRDLAAAFERKGHFFQTLMDPSDNDVLPLEQIASTIRRQKPDLLFSIDHLRAEFGQLIPQNLPYVCWIQDLLPHLMNASAGRSHGSHDFYVTPTLSEFIRTYEYPARRGMVWTMVTNAAMYDSAPLPQSELSPHLCDFSYVSNQSTPPNEFHARYRKSISSPAGQRLCDHILGKLTHEFATRAAVPRAAMKIIAEARGESGIEPADAEAADRLARNYIHPLTELLFRQSTLRWVADYCDARGLKLDLYGRGWESHPRFAKYARGEAQNGRMLRTIFQATRINLQINGYGSIHQRLLDGLASGGFFMIRECPFDRIHAPTKDLLDQVRRHDLRPGSHDAGTYGELGSAWRRANLCNAIDVGDTAEIRLTQKELDLYGELESSDYRRVAGAVFAEYDQVAFANQQEFAARADRFLSNGSDRRNLCNPMRDAVLARFTYDGLVDALIAFLAARLN